MKIVLLGKFFVPSKNPASSEKHQKLHIFKKINTGIGEMIKFLDLARHKYREAILQIRIFKLWACLKITGEKNCLSNLQRAV